MMTERERLLKRLSSYDFAVNEFHIYLDTHPDDDSAAEALKAYEAKADALRNEYEEKYGPLTSMSETANRWAWISDPWPWDTMEG